MPRLSYQEPGLVLKRDTTGPTDAQIRDLQRHLRCLGYLRQGIDGDFGGGTERAVKALQHDLLHNDGSGTDGAAPVSVRDYNAGRVAAATGEVDQDLAACVAEMLEDEDLPKLPFSDDPVAENQRILAEVAALSPVSAPIPFLRAILQRESNLKHFHEPSRADDQDGYITIGLDANDRDNPHAVTSRGFGVGQYTLFHHPPRKEEVADFMLDVGRNVRKAMDELREKFDHFVNGATSGTQADDRLAEVGRGELRLCKFAESDPRFMKDCKACAQQAGTQNLETGEVPWYAGSSRKYGPSQYYDYRRLDLTAIPVRKDFACDWPYAVRRYNGSGPNSYNYQALVLKNLLTL